MKKLILFLSFFILISFAGVLQAQNQVNIKIKQPPPGQLNIENLWSFTLRNNTNEKLEVYLKGTATEEKDGLIATGKTVSITLNAKETKNMKVSDLPKTPDIDYNAKDPKYKESLIRQGKFPAGSYEICVNVFSAGTNEELGSDCINQEVMETGLITLISPSDGEEINSKILPVFIWTGKPGDSYKIKIVEILANQSPETAIEKNKAFFEKEGLRTTTFTYPSAGKKFEGGKKYAWVVKGGNVMSEVISFMIVSVGGEITLSLTPLQEGTCCFEVNVDNSSNNLNFDAFRITLPTNTIQSANPINSTVNPTVPPFINSILWRVFNGFPIGKHSYGTVCFGDIQGEFDVNIQWSTNGGVVYMGEDNIQINCQSVQTGFCPGNRFRNGDFEIGDPNLLGDQDIDRADGWLAIWQTGSLADFYPSNSSPSIFAPPCPVSGNYASCWISNVEENNAVWREGMFGTLLNPINNNTGSFTFSFDMANLSSYGDSEIGIYGIYNPPPVQLGNQPSSSHSPSNMGLFGINRTMLLGTIPVPEQSGCTKQNYNVSFSSSDPNFPANGITHILITRSDNIMNGKSYCAFDNFCMRESEIQPNPCVEFNANSTNDPVQCCMSLTLNQPGNYTNLKNIEITPVNPAQYSTTPVFNSGYNSNFGILINTPSNISLKPKGSNPNILIPPDGKFNDIFSVCLTPGSPDRISKIVVVWKDLQDQEICRDTLTVSCVKSCIEKDSVSIKCKTGGGFEVKHYFKNIASFPITGLEVTNINPSGPVISPTSVVFNPNIPNNHTTQGMYAFDLTNIGSNKNVCIAIKYLSPDTCCYCYDTLCITTPNCECDTTTLNAYVTDGNIGACCYDLMLKNLNVTDFDRVDVVSITPGVYFRTIDIHNGWDGDYDLSTPTNIAITKAPTPTSKIPTGSNLNPVRFCLSGYTTEDQKIVVNWIRSDQIACSDTLTLHCIPPPPSGDCVVISTDNIICNSNNTITYSFRFTNFSSSPTYTVRAIKLRFTSPTGISDIDITDDASGPLNVTSGSMSDLITVTIPISSGQFCYQIGTYDQAVIQPFHECCWTEPICKTANCNGETCSCKESNALVSINGAAATSVNCGSIMTISNGNSVSITYNNMGFTEPSCQITNSGWLALQPDGTTTQGSGLIATMNIGWGMYRIVGWVTNGRDTCKCSIAILNSIPPGCNCGSWDSDKISVKGEDVSGTLTCGQIINNSGTGNGINLQFPNFTCIGNNCSARYEWKITGPIPRSGTGNYIDNADFSQNGTYNIKVYAYCGEKLCDSCWIETTVVGKPCECSENGWKKEKDNIKISGAINKNISCGDSIDINEKNNITINIPEYECKPSSCPPDFKWEIKNSNGSSVTSGAGDVINYTFATAGTYSISMIAKCNGLECDTCYIFIKVKGTDDCNCDYDENKVTINGVSYSFDCGEGYQENVFVNDNILFYPGLKCSNNCSVSSTSWNLTGPNGFSTYGTSFPIALTPQVDGVYYLSSFIVCGGDTCRCITKIRAEKKSECDCRKGRWNLDKSRISYEIDKLKKDEPIKCDDGKYTINNKSSVTLNPRYICPPECGKASYSYKINGGTMTSPQTTPFVIPDIINTTNVTIYAWCGNTICDSCKITIIPKESPKCDCNSDMYLIAGTIGKNDSIKIRCKETKTMEQGSVVRLIPANICNPADCLSEWDMQIFDAQMGTWIATSNGTGINSYYDLVLTSPAGYRIVFKGLCGDKKCECEFWIRTKPVECNCQRGRWDIGNSRISYISNLYRNDPINCDSTYNVTYGSSIGLDPVYVCPQPNCAVSYSYKINGVNYPRQTVPFNIQSVSSNTNVTMYAWCGKTICDSCKITIIPKESPKCDCGGWTNMRYTVKNGKSVKVTCKDTILLKGPSAITFDYGYICIPKNCKPSIKWEVIGPVPGSGPGIYGFSYNFSQPGTYSVILNADCEGKSCPPCTLTVKVDGSTGCNCVIPDLPNIRIVPPNSAVQNVPCNSLSIQTFTTPGLFTITPPPVTCQGNGCKATYAWFINGQRVPEETSQMITPFNFVGTYEIERRASCSGMNGLICFSCKFSLRIRNKWPSGGFGGVPLGDIGTKKPDVSPTVFNPDRTLRPDFKWSTSGTSGKQKYFRIVEIIPREGTTDISDMEKDLSEKEPYFEVIAESNFLAYPKEMPELKKGSIYLWVVYELGDNDDNASMLDVGLFQAGSDTPFLKGIPCEECKKTCTNGVCFWLGSGACICFERPND